MQRAESVSRLETIYTELYENEPPDCYDMPAAVQFWRSLPTAQLEDELTRAEEKLAHYRS